MTDALREVLAAWINSGDSPAVLHIGAQNRLRVSWPELAGALDRAAGLDAEALRAQAMRLAGAEVPRARTVPPPGPWATPPGSITEERKES